MLACGVLVNVQRRDLRTLELSRRCAASEIGVEIENLQVVAQRQTRKPGHKLSFFVAFRNNA
jgi:hypothetical protein